MDNLYGHHHSHHRHHYEEEENSREEPNYPPPESTFPTFDQPPPPAPPTYFGLDESPVPPPEAHVTHVLHSSSYPPSPPEDFEQQPPPFDSFDHHGHDSAAMVEHVDHHCSDQPPNEEFDETHHHHHRYSPHFPFFGHRHEHQGPSSDISGKPIVQVYSKADHHFSLAIRDGKVILAQSDPDDDSQHWYKDEKYSTQVKDEEGFPCFSLINKATGQALKHSVGATHPVQLITPYNNPNALDESILWTESKDLGDGYRAIRMVNNIHLNLDAFHGDKHSGGIHDGTIIVLWKWNKGDNQRWKIIPY